MTATQAMDMDTCPKCGGVVGVDDCEDCGWKPNAPRRVAEHPKVHASVWPKVERLHAAHFAAAGPALDLATVLLNMIAEGRGEFVGGGGWSSNFAGDRIEAVIHAAQHGYTLCDTKSDSWDVCWLPTGHAGDCLFGHGWEWGLAYREPTAVPNLTCTKCKPTRRMRRDETCPHTPAVGGTS